MNRILLDTNAYARYISGDERVLDALGAADTVYLSTIVAGELFAGFRGGTLHRQNRVQLSTFLQKPTVRELTITMESAEIFGQVKDALKRAGTPIPMNDVWISAQAIETGSVLVTYDGHFSKVPGLRLWDPA
ncbi:MAG: type II toxin-antitoxin system VapC family toxin [Gemmatimonadetes bacterium]|nr:type II toxin-antitoxin system VapC family toxin [Gemmatimonadota bacterium]MBT7862971.1 type II toxin-antitoxin system VapC family toxin [Gemmatimonadota bacterium]